MEEYSPAWSAVGSTGNANITKKARLAFVGCKKPKTQKRPWKKSPYPQKVRKLR